MTIFTKNGYLTKDVLIPESHGDGHARSATIDHDLFNRDLRLILCKKPNDVIRFFLFIDD
jgi:hypothetical protein